MGPFGPREGRMMKRILWASLATLGLAALPAQAQVTNTTRPVIGPRQAVSPFLNLRQNNNTGLDFFLRVRPDQQTFNTLQQLQQEVTLGQTTPTTGDATTTTVITGHAARF